MTPSTQPAALPQCRDLSEAQVRGKACVHCGIVLDNATAIDLGTRTAHRAGSVIQWFPRACPSHGTAA